MPTQGTKVRTVRVDKQLWDAAKAATERRGETISDVVRERLKEYVAEPESQPREVE